MYPLTAGLVIANTEVADAVKACLQNLPVRILLEQADIADWNSFLEKLGRLRPDVILLELANLGNGLEEGIRRIRRTSGAPVVVAIHESNDPDMILRSVRAGAAEYLYPPFELSLTAAMERISSECAQQRGVRSGGKTLAFLSAKGGCGATTVACHTAVNLQRLTRQEVLLADFDLETGVVGFLMKSKSQYTVLDAMGSINRLDLSYWKALVSNGIPGLEVIKAPVTVPRQGTDHDRLRHVLSFVRPHYEWIVVDLGRSLSSRSMNSLEEVDETFLVTTLDVPALYRAKHVVRTLLDTGYGRERLHLVLNRVPKRSDVTADEIQEMLGLPAYLSLPEDYTTVYDSYAEGKLLPPNTNLGRQMTLLASKISGISEDKNKKRLSIFG